MTPTATSDLLLPGYWVDEPSGAWCSSPWPQDPDERMAIVRSSLGPALIDWAEWRTDEPGLTHYLSGGQWRYTPGQKRFIILWYWVNEDGRFPYRRAVKRGAKGTGKDPFAGTIADTELCGPVELYDWDDKTGRPIGRRRGLPLIQIASNSEAQSKDLLRVANALWNQEARDFYGIDCGETRTALKATFGRVEINTFAEASNEGDPVTCSLLNETHHMTTDEGHRVARQARRNVGKSPASVQARSIEFTNGHRSGGGSVGEKSFEAWQVQQAPKYRGKRDILYDSIDAPPDADIMIDASRMAGLRAAYYDSPWADLERINDEMLDPDTPVSDSIRYYFNRLGAEEDSWIDPANWDLLAKPREVPDGTQIAMFLDCSKSEDATALMACTLDMHLFTIDVWERPKGAPKDWRVPRPEVDASVRAAWAKYRVEWYGVDPSPAKDDTADALYWQDLIDGWVRDFRDKLHVWATPGVKGSPVVFDMRMSVPGGRERNYAFTKAAELVQGWVDEERDEGPFTHDGHPITRQHAHNAKARPNAYGTSLSKVTRDSHKLVDAAVAGVGAVMGARAALASGKVKIRRSARRVRGVVYG